MQIRHRADKADALLSSRNLVVNRRPVCVKRRFRDQVAIMRFYCALRTIVEDPAFSTREMRTYMTRKTYGELDAVYLEETIDYYEGLAITVLRYVRAKC